MRGNYSLRRYERLRGSLRFKIIKQETRPFKGEFFVINISPNKLPFNRIGISISSKTILKSSRRNKLKRLIRECCRLHKDELKKGLDIVIRPKKTIVVRDPSFKEVEGDLLNIFKRAKI